MSFSMRDENGFTPAQAAELQKRIDEIEQGNVVRHDYTRVPYRYLTWCLLMMEIVESENDLCDDEYRQVATQQDFYSF